METKIKLLEIYESLDGRLKHILSDDISPSGTIDKKLNATCATLGLQIFRTLKIIGVLNANLLCQAWMYSQRNMN